MRRVQPYFYRTLCLVQLPRDNLLLPSVAHYWTPHSGHAFLPSYSSALKVEKTTRDFLGGWNAQGSDRYSRVARYVFSQCRRQFSILFVLQKVLILLSIRKRSKISASFRIQLHCQMMSKFLWSEPWKRDQSSLSRWLLTKFQRMYKTSSHPWKNKQRFRSSSQSRKSAEAQLGTDPRAKRAQMLFYATRLLPLLFLERRTSRLFTNSGLASLCLESTIGSTIFLGNTFPSVASFDTICKLCGRNLDNPDWNSDVPFTSSSSNEEIQ